MWKPRRYLVISMKMNLRLLAIALAVPVMSLIGSLFTNQTATAWCNNISIADMGGSYDTQCVAENYDALPQSVKNEIDLPTYKKKIGECQNGNKTNLDYGVHEGGCADAVRTCLAEAASTSLCTADATKNMVTAGLGQSQDYQGCNNGQLTGNNGNNCKALEDINTQALEDIQKSVEAKALEACKSNIDANDPNKASKEQAYKDECKRAISESGCQKPSIQDSGRIENKDASVDAYKTCLNNALKQGARNSEECTGRGGLWVDQANTGNGLTQGCKNQYSDLVNPEACAASGANGKATGAWASNDGGKTWGCHSPDEVCNKPDQWKINDQRPCAQENIDKVEKPEDADAEGVDGKADTTVNGQCGAARTNLISCDGTGAVALNNVLKIVISVLTVLVGIAAVGGLAWASILYAKATDNQASVSEARTLIQNIVIGLLVYVFLLAIVNFLIPGGIFPT